MKMKSIIFGCIALFSIILMSCQSTEPNTPSEINPAAEGFNFEASDSMAIAVADLVMEAMGGRQNWDNTRYLKWNFFGSRRHIWDKHTGDVIIEGIRDTFISKFNIHSMEGKVNYRGIELTKADSLDQYIQKAKEMWINDSYWLLFPYKFKDSGVSLKYLDLDSTKSGEIAHVLELTFAEVGVTPENKYLAYVDTSSNLVTQWDFYRNYTDTIPRFSTPWINYEKYGEILLSSSRGENYNLPEISTSDTLSVYFE